MRLKRQLAVAIAVLCCWSFPAHARSKFSQFIQQGGALVASSDATYDIGNGTNDPRDISASRNITSRGGNILVPTTGLYKLGSNYYGYTNGTGPKIYDASSDNVLTMNVQSLTTSRTWTVADLTGTVALVKATGSASLDFGVVAANTCSDLTLTTTGAVSGDEVVLGIPSALGSTTGLMFSGFVSSSNTTTVRACNVRTSSSADPAVATVTAIVFTN